MSDDSRDGSRPPADSVDARQAALVAAGILALVVAAFVAPAAVAPGSDDAGDDRQSTDARGEGGDGIVPFFLRELLLDPSGTEADDPGGDARCVVALDSEPTPGRDARVRVGYDSAPLADAPVWFDDDFVGRTDADGEVVGEVPYVRTLHVRVGLEDRPDCVGVARTGGGPAAGAATASPSLGDRGAAADGGSTRSTGATGADAASRAGAGAVVTGVDAASLAGGTAGAIRATGAGAADSNATVTYEIDAELSVRVFDDPYPGATVTLRALLEGDPVSDAAVAVDGTTVDRTDDDGTATFTVPDDGTDTVRVAVSRGEFRAVETVDVALLDVDLRGAGLAVVPGADATVEATLGGEPAPDAAVGVDGERRGATGPDGRSAVVLPTDPTAPVTVAAADQTATTSVVDHYTVPAAAIALLLAGVAGLASRRRGARGALKAVGAGGALVALVVAVVVTDAFYGPTGGFAVLLGVAVPVAVVILVRWRPDPRSGAAATRSLLAGLAGRVGRALAVLRSPRSAIRGLVGSLREHLLAGALRAAGAAGRVYDAAQRLAANLASLGSLPRSASALLALAVARTLSTVRRLAVGVRGAPAAVVAALSSGVLAVSVGYAVGWRIGIAAGTALVGVAAAVALLVRLSRREGGDDATSQATGSVPSEAGADPASDRAFRELWRSFARLVVHDGLRTKTPAEVSQAAIDRGYPPAPVEELTTLFREVEYGGRPLSDAVYERAVEAHAALRPDDGGDDL